MVENPYYKRYGSGYSLYIGLQKAFETGADEILFAEGDLHLSTNDYKKVCNAKKVWSLLIEILSLQIKQ